MSSQTKCGILLANTGTPSAPTPRAVRKYLGQFLLDKRIAPMNRMLWWLIVHIFILPRRGGKSGAKYERIWTDEGSPFAVANEKLTRGLQAAFIKDGHDDVKVVCGMSYGEPSIAEALRQLKDAGCDQVFVLPMYPQSAYSTTGAVYDGIERGMAKLKWDVPCHLIDNYHDNPTYVRAIAASLKNAGIRPDSDDKVLFSFHSTPTRDIEAGDTYELQSSASSLQIASELGLDRKQWTIGYQCRFDKGREWLTPFTADVLDRWAEAGVGRIFFICPGFSVDCLETLYDVEYELKPHYLEACRQTGRPAHDCEFIYVPCLGTSKAHVKVLQGILYPYIEGI